MPEVISVELHHIGLVPSDPEHLGRVLLEIVGASELPRSDGHRDFALGRTVLRLHDAALEEVPEDGRPLRYLALRAPDLGEVTARVEAAGLDAAKGRGRDGRGEILLRPEQWGGIPLVVTDSALPGGDPGTAGERPTSGRKVDHVGVACEDLQLVRDRFCGTLGLLKESEETDTEMLVPVEQFTSDKYGSWMATQRRKASTSAIRALFVTLSDLELEFLEDADPDGGPTAGAAAASEGTEAPRGGSQGADSRVISRHIERFGPGLAHLAVAVPDVDTALRQAHEAGAELVDSQGRGGARRSQIGFLHPRSTGKLLIHFVEHPERW